MATATASQTPVVTEPEYGSPAAIRAWANANGQEVGVRGRISGTLREAYLAANKAPRRRAAKK